ncbi:hypothetical protein LCM20_12250 [Halobacillus litoralis]|uniref:hypothetical protein n=1 Tax=Halobacillus litoralis TaxID=45668 RepID=UPI001CD34556|nr:hypothetical protein [Halobacillus litoralis]MCA0971368.1 hypothetical protein [Halobacillus litoralis]
MNIAIIVMLVVISVFFYRMNRQLKEQLTQSMGNMETKLESTYLTLSEQTNQSIQEVQQQVEKEAGAASKERTAHYNQLAAMEKRVAAATAERFEDLRGSMTSHSDAMQSHIISEIKKSDKNAEVQFDRVNKMEEELQKSMEEASSSTEDKLTALMDGHTLKLREIIIQSQQNNSTHIGEQTTELLTAHKDSLAGVTNQLVSVQKELTKEFRSGSEEILYLVGSRGSATTPLSDPSPEKENANVTEETWIAEVEKKENTVHALKLLESALIQLPGSRPLFKIYRETMVNRLREQKPADQKMMMERLMKFTHDHLTWCQPQLWKYAFEDYKALSALRVQYAERARELFLQDFENKIETMESMLDAEEDIDVIKAELERIDQQVQHNVLQHYPEEQKRYDSLASKLMTKLSSTEDPRRISYNKWAISVLRDVHTSFNSLSEYEQSADRNVRAFANSLAEIDTSLLTSESQIYYQSIYHDIFKVATASFKPRMTKIVLQADKTALGAV